MTSNLECFSLQLEKDGQKCTSIHGDLDHEARDRVVNEFREGKTRVLIATDVLSRGFDVQQVKTSLQTCTCSIGRLNAWHLLSSSNLSGHTAASLLQENTDMWMQEHRILQLEQDKIILMKSAFALTCSSQVKFVKIRGTWGHQIFHTTFILIIS